MIEIFFFGGGGGLKTTQCAILHLGTGSSIWRMVVRYCTADALKRHEPVNAFNLVLIIIIRVVFSRRVGLRSSVIGRRYRRS